jgi:hypothetical protein
METVCSSEFPNPYTRNKVAQADDPRDRKHGTFRPKLLQLVQSNTAPAIESTTREAFTKLRRTHDAGGAVADADGSPAAALDAIKVLTQLKGIGPATASLLLSVAAPASVPFFSDELFRWVMWGEGGKPGGWKTGIKYNVKEYREVVERVGLLRKRLGVRAVDAEKVAWVLGKEGVDVGFVDVEGEEGRDEEGVVEPKGDDKSTKRKRTGSTNGGVGDTSDAQDEDDADRPAKATKLDPDKQCGVPLSGDHGGHCTRPLTCKGHSMTAKRAVTGRSQPYDTLLAQHMKGVREERSKRLRRSSRNQREVEA